MKHSILGSGGHGLATACYLAKEHGITDVAMLEKGRIGDRSTGGDTTIVQSGHYLTEKARLCAYSLKLWKGLSQELDCDVMFRPRGVDIIQHREVIGIRRDGNRVLGIETTQGFIGAAKVGMAVAGHSSVVAGMAGLRLPIESHALQAMASEPVQPMLDTAVISDALLCSVSQSDKIELVMGGNIDRYNSHNSYARRGNLPALERVVGSVLALFPVFSRLRLVPWQIQGHARPASMTSSGGVRWATGAGSACGVAR